MARRFSRIGFRLIGVFLLTFVSLLLVVVVEEYLEVQSREERGRHDREEKTRLLTTSFEKSLDSAGDMLEIQGMTILEQGLRGDEARMLLKSVSTRQPVSKVLVLDASGTVLVSTDPSIEGRDYLGKSAVSAVLREGKQRFVHAVDLGEGEPPHFHLSVLVKDGRQVLGAVSSQVELAGFAGSLAIEGLTDHFFLVDSDGFVAYDSSARDSIADRKVDLSRHPLVVRASNRAQHWKGSLLGSAATESYTSMNVADTGWVAVAVETPETVFTHEWTFGRYVPGAMMVLAVCTAALGLWVSRGVLVPLGSLLQSVRWIGEGKLETPVTLRTGDEFEVLAGAVEQARLSVRDDIHELNALVDLAAKLIRSLTLDEVLEATREGAIGLFDARAVLVTLRQPRTKEPEPVLVWRKTPDALDEGEAMRALGRGVAVRSLGGRPVLHTTLETFPRAAGDLVVVVDERMSTARHAKLAEAFGGLVSLALYNAATYQAECHIAAVLQEPLLSLPEHLDGIELASRYIAADEVAFVGGDFYDAFEMGPGRFGVLIGDVSGKGIGAAVLTYLVKYTVEALASTVSATPSSVIMGLNRRLFEVSQVESFVTAVFGVADLASGSFTYCNAGHLAPLLVDSDGTLQPLEPTGPIAGAFENASFDVSSVPLSPGATLVLVTDGLTEARRGAERYGEERFRSLLSRSVDLDCPALLETIVADVSSFARNGLDDDLAVLVVRRTA